jgi:hypothetical protein
VGNRLFAVAARGSADVYAVGESGYPARSLVIRWNGSAWSRVTTPDVGALRAVAVSPTTVWVAGNRKVQSLSNGVWRQLPALPAGSGTVWLSGLANGSTGLWAVGTDQVPFFEGFVYRPYAAVWNGTSWAKVTVPGSAGLSAVTAAGPHVLATSANAALRLPTGGATTEVTPALSSTQLAAIAADSAGQPWAVGWTATGSTVRPAIINAPGINQGGFSVTTGFAGASVTWIGPSNGSGVATQFGTFQVGGIPEGSYTLVVSGQGCPPRVVTATVTAGLASAVDARVTC